MDSDEVYFHRTSKSIWSFAFELLGGKWLNLPVTMKVKS